MESPLTSPLPLKKSALVPTAVFCVPLLLSNKATAPTAVLESMAFNASDWPNASAPAPTVVLKPPMVLAKSARQPSAVFPEPVVRERSVSHPSAVVKFG